ncbi:MAG: hypothetical protein AAF387_19090 [Pseudomonadota bacterium]
MRNLKLIYLILLGAFAQPLLADTVGVMDPPGWNRGDANTGYLEFDYFNGLTNATLAQGGVFGKIEQTLDLGFPPAGTYFDLGEELTDNRIYVHSSAANWDISVTEQPFMVSTVVLQIKERAGSGLDSLNPTANGETADSVFVYDDGNSNAITRWLFLLDAPIAPEGGLSLNIANGPFSFYSYDSFSVDLNAAAVPVPAAVWMFASALLVLGKRLRQRV